MNSKIKRVIILFAIAGILSGTAVNNVMAETISSSSTSNTISSESNFIDDYFKVLPNFLQGDNDFEFLNLDLYRNKEKEIMKKESIYGPSMLLMDMRFTGKVYNEKIKKTTGIDSATIKALIGIGKPPSQVRVTFMEYDRDNLEKKLESFEYNALKDTGDDYKLFKYKDQNTSKMDPKNINHGFYFGGEIGFFKPVLTGPDFFMDSSAASTLIGYLETMNSLEEEKSLLNHSDLKAIFSKLGEDDKDIKKNTLRIIRQDKNKLNYIKTDNPINFSYIYIVETLGEKNTFNFIIFFDDKSEMEKAMSKYESRIKVLMEKDERSIKYSGLSKDYKISTVENEGNNFIVISSSFDYEVSDKFFTTIGDLFMKAFIAKDIKWLY